MALVVPNAGELRLLNILLKLTSKTDDMHLKLYHNDVTPDANSMSASFASATFDGYTIMPLARATWNSAVVSSTKAESSYGSAALSWTCGATGDTVYGYWVEDSADGVCMWAERFGTARQLSNTDILNITPKFTLESEN